MEPHPSALVLADVRLTVIDVLYLYLDPFNYLFHRTGLVHVGMLDHILEQLGCLHLTVDVYGVDLVDWLD
jgi:hypothetical protein